MLLLLAMSEFLGRQKIVLAAVGASLAAGVAGYVLMGGGPREPEGMQVDKLLVIVEATCSSLVWKKFASWTFSATFDYIKIQN